MPPEPADVRAVAPRSTRQQAAVRAILDDVDEFRSAQQLHALLQRQGQSIGLATVYRALARMVDEGAVDALMRDDGETLYRRCSTGHHHHLVCRRCGRTVEVEGPAVETWARTVATGHGFQEVSHTVEVFGLCPECANARPAGDTVDG